MLKVVKQSEASNNQAQGRFRQDKRKTGNRLHVGWQGLTRQRPTAIQWRLVRRRARLRAPAMHAAHRGKGRAMHVLESLLVL